MIITRSTYGPPRVSGVLCPYTAVADHLSQRTVIVLSDVNLTWTVDGHRHFCFSLWRWISFRVLQAYVFGISWMSGFPFCTVRLTTDYHIVNSRVVCSDVSQTTFTRPRPTPPRSGVEATRDQDHQPRTTTPAVTATQINQAVDRNSYNTARQRGIQTNCHM